jgi:predicted nucleic acid-binding protein
MLLLARHRDARVVVSAVTLAEVLRGTPRDAATYRVLTRIAELPVTSEVGRAAGALLGSTGLSGATVDAVVAATALRQTGPVLLVTSDPSDMAALTASRTDLAVAAV